MVDRIKWLEMPGTIQKGIKEEHSIGFENIKEQSEMEQNRSRQKRRKNCVTSDDEVEKGFRT